MLCSSRTKPALVLGRLPERAAHDSASACPGFLPVSDTDSQLKKKPRHGCLLLFGQVLSFPRRIRSELVVAHSSQLSFGRVGSAVSHFHISIRDREPLHAMPWATHGKSRRPQANFNVTGSWYGRLDYCQHRTVTKGLV